MRSIDVVYMPPERHFPADPVAKLREQDAAIARMQGERTRMLARVATEGEGNEFLAEEVAVELGCSPNTARNRLYQARRLCERLPDTVEALCTGRIDWPKAAALEEITTPLTPEQAHAAEQWTLERATSKPLAAFTACARRRVLRVDPHGAADRAQARRAERRVWLRPLDDGMAELGAHLPAALATAAFDRIDRLARAARTDGDDRPMDAVRADVAVDLLTGHDRRAATDSNTNTAGSYTSRSPATSGGPAPAATPTRPSRPASPMPTHQAIPSHWRADNRPLGVPVSRPRRGVVTAGPTRRYSAVRSVTSRSRRSPGHRRAEATAGG